MICTCRTCKHAFWKYRSDWDYPGFCSWLCFTLRVIHPHGETVEDVKFTLRIHLEFSHGGEITGADWFPDCRRCEELQEQLADLRRLEVCFASQAK